MEKTADIANISCANHLLLWNQEDHLALHTHVHFKHLSPAKGVHLGRYIPSPYGVYSHQTHLFPRPTGQSSVQTALTYLLKVHPRSKVTRDRSFSALSSTQDSAQPLTPLLKVGGRGGHSPLKRVMMFTILFFLFFKLFI